MGHRWEDWKLVNSGMGFDQTEDVNPHPEAQAVPSFRAVEVSGGAAVAAVAAEPTHDVRHPALAALHSYFDIRD